MTNTTLYAAVGGADAVERLVAGLYERLVADPVVQHHFSPDRLPSLKAAQVAWFSAVLDGGAPPTDLAKAHADVEITDEQVAALVGHLDRLLGEANLDHRTRRAINALVSRLWYARMF